VPLDANQVWMLLTSGEAAGIATPLRARLAEGARGEGLRRIDVAGASEDARASALRGAGLAYTLLYREKYVDRRLIARFEAGAPLTNLQGASGDLAFALALAAGLTRADGGESLTLPPLAATGVLNDEGRLSAIDGFPAKLAAALDVLPAGGVVVYPQDNAPEVTADLRRRAGGSGVELLASASLEEALRGLGVSLSQTWLDAPFRGLEPFEFRHAAIFFGRDQEIEDILALIRHRAAQGRHAVLVEGPSGAGKSSLVLAGVIPALLRRGGPDRPAGGLRWGLLRPGGVRAGGTSEAELDDLAAAAQAAWLHDDQDALSPRALSGREVLAPDRFLASLAGDDAAPPRLVWVIDQLEQWFVAGLQPATVLALTNLLAGLTERGVTLIATGAGAVSEHLAEHPDLAAAFGVEGRYQIARELDAARMEAVIREPARAARLHFEPGLDAEIFAAASQGGSDVLPLLELLLTELYERRDQARNRLRLADYKAVGGLDGVISSRAEQVFSQASAEEQAAFPELIWRLSTRGEIVLADHPPGTPLRALVEACRARRLLTTQAVLRGEPAVRPAHEALLRHWPRAVEQRRADEADIRLWLDLVRESGQWSRAERSPIPPGPQLGAAESLRLRRKDTWTDRDRLLTDYIDISVRLRRRRRLAIGFALGVPVLAALGFGVFTLVGMIEATHRTVVDLARIPVPSTDHFVPASTALRGFGINVIANSPETAVPVIVNNIDVYQGRAASPTYSQHFLTQAAKVSAAPVSYTLQFDRPVKAVVLLRPALWAATCSGVTHPAWTAVAYDRGGVQVASSSEILSRAIPWFDPQDRSKPCPFAHVLPQDVPAATYRLQARGDGLIARLVVTSDDRLDGVPFAGMQGALIERIELIR
jgi:hypothetical protein